MSLCCSSGSEKIIRNHVPVLRMVVDPLYLVIFVGILQEQCSRLAGSYPQFQVRGGEEAGHEGYAAANTLVQLGRGQQGGEQGPGR
jgi:hypothetical protein